MSPPNAATPQPEHAGRASRAANGAASKSAAHTPAQPADEIGLPGSPLDLAQQQAGTQTLLRGLAILEAAAAGVRDLRSFGAALGTIPDYSGPPGGQKGVLLADVRKGGAAEKAGMRRGDILVQLGAHPIGSVEDLMYVLQAAKPGETVTATVLREGKPVQLEATFQEAHRAR